MSAIRDITAWSLGATSGIYVTPASGLSSTLPLTAETVSGPIAVCFNQSGQVIVAMASISGRWPAVGLATQNALSGQPVAWGQTGTIQYSSGLADFSGLIQRRVWLGRSGQVVTISGAWGSGGWLSGDVGQPLGTIINSGAIAYNVFPAIWSGGPLGVATGGAF